MKLDRTKLLAASALALCAVAYPAAGMAGLYKWTDAQGNLHITDVPPPAPEKTPEPRAEPTPQISRPLPKQDTSVLSQSPAGRKRAEVAPVPGPMTSSHALKKMGGGGAHVPVTGLRPEQATGTSPWEVLEGKQGNAKAGVQRWKDEQGVEHFVDVLPSGKRGGG